MQEFYKQTEQEVLANLQTAPTGLTATEAKQRLDHYGPNQLKIRGESIWRKLTEPFRSVFMLILSIAAVISIITNEPLDAAIILFIIGVTVAIYYVQRFSAERVLRALEKHDVQIITAYRDGKMIEIPSEELVPGDVITLSEGQKVPADARILRTENTRTDESMLTGESTPISKHSHPLKTDRQIYERTNLIFQGSFIVSGTVTAVVTATGNQTEFGQIAALTKRTDLVSPMQRKIDKLISQIVAAVAILALLVFLLSLTRGIDVADSLRLVMTLSVSAVPEGLPIAISVVLVLGMRRMAKYQALVRSMSAIENIGIVTTVATDKTGTLTKNQLSVQDVWTPRKDADLQQNAGYALLSINHSDGKMFDPLDTAFKNFADKYNRSVASKFTIAKTMPFEYQFAMSGNVWQHGDKYDVYVKGAPERVIAICDLSKAAKEEILQKLHSLTGQGYRAIAIARLADHKKPPKELKDVVKHKFEFLSLLAVADELRPEAKPSILATRQAGVTVRMITGDHFETAYAIAKQLGLAEHRDQVFDCTKMADMSDKELEKVVADIRVFSRVLPEYKHRILGILKEQDITAMTGDGVNDVPALTNAHIGVAMGSGTQIAKEAGDIVLLDDNFKSITQALRQGRIIFDNIRRMLFYLLSTNLGEVLTTVGALLLGMPLPLLPVQILWTNLGTDTAMVIPLGLEPAERDVMQRKPRHPKRPILGKVIISRMVLVGLTMMAVALSLFHYFLQSETETYARTIAFSALVVMQLTNALNARSEWQSIFARMRVINPTIFIGLFAALVLYTLAVFGPLNEILHMDHIRLTHLAVTWGIAITAITIVNELHKLAGRKMFDKS